MNTKNGQTNCDKDLYITIEKKSISVTSRNRNRWRKREEVYALQWADKADKDDDNDHVKWFNKYSTSQAKLKVDKL